MSKKGVLLVLGSSLILSIFLIAFISAANDTATAINSSARGSFDKAYSCLETQLNDKLSSAMTTEDLAFSLLAAGYNGDLQSKLVTKLGELKSDNAECWPSSGCTIKDTAQVMLAYDHIGKDTTEIKNWLMNQTIAPVDLTWYLQIDTENQSKCSIKYDGSSKTVNIDENKIITGSAGSCLKSANNGYWLQMDSSCYGKDFEVSCDENFLISTFFKRASSTTSAIYYLTSSTQSEAPNRIASTRVDSSCFKQGSTCNYEGNLWATLALSGDASIKDRILPYLITLSPDNQRYLPSSFLYALTDYNEYLTELVNQQSRQGYWKISETSRQYYDTAVALIKLGTSGSEQATLADSYLLDTGVQTKEGCWNGNNLRDTAFLLYSVDPKSAKSSTGAKTCSDYLSSGYSCITSTACDSVNGTQQPYGCLSLGTICCTKSAVQTETCSAKGGTKCSSTQRCTGTTISALGTTSCCIDGTCEDIPQPGGLSACEQQGYKCMIQCDNTQQSESAFECSADSGGVCCSPKPATQATNHLWIWLLIVLVILLVLAIIFRDQVKMWWFKIKNKFSKSPAPISQQRPMMPPGGARPMPYPFRPTRIVPGMMPPRGYPPPRAPPLGQARPFPKEKELDETLKKIKDMGKQ